MVRRTTFLVAVVSALVQPGGSARQLSSGGIEIEWFSGARTPDADRGTSGAHSGGSRADGDERPGASNGWRGRCLGSRRHE